MSNSYQESIDKAKKDIAELKSSLNKLHEDILQNATAFRNLLQSTGTSNLKEFNRLVAENNKLTKESINLKAKITTTQKNYNTAIQNQTNLLSKNKNVLKSRTKEEIKYEKAMKKAFDRQNQYAKSYNVLLKKYREARKNLRDLILLHGVKNKLVRQAQRENDRLSKKLALVNKNTKKTKKGLGGVIGVFRSFLGAFGIVVGIRMIVDFTRTVFELTKELNSLSFSIKTVIKDQVELAHTTQFLKQITNDYGADIISTTRRYIKFRAATKEANMTASETQKIFGTVTKAAGVLGLKTDELTGIYLALEQMISKGKVTTEELRRQLGERLPGAFDIMAKAVGVSTSELDKMLKAGEVLSSEALPKFVVALEEAYGLESVGKVETMVASQIRMNNAWKSFVISVEGGSGRISKVFKELFDFSTDVLEQLEKMNQTQEDLVKEIRFGEYSEQLKKIPKEWDLITKHVEKFGSEQDKINFKQHTYLEFLEREKKKQEESVQELSKGMQVLFEKRTELEKYTNLLDHVNGYIRAQAREQIKILEIEIDKLENEEKSLALAKGKLDAIKELIKILTKTKADAKEDEASKAIRLRAEKVIKEKDTSLQILKIGAEMNKKLVEDDEKSYAERMSLLDDLFERRKLITNETLNSEIRNAKLSTKNALKNIEDRKKARVKELQKILDDEKVIQKDKEAARENERKNLEIDIQNKKTLRDNEREEILLARAKHAQNLEKDLQEQRTLRNSIQKDQLDDIKENLKAIEDAEKVVRDRKIQEANGDKDKLKEIEKEHFEAVLQLQSNYIAEVLRENENLTEEQIKILVAMLTKMGAEMAKAADKTKNNLKEMQKFFKDTFATVTDTFSNAFGIDTSKFNFIFDELAKNFDKLDETSSKLFDREKLGEWADAAKEIIGGVLNANLQRYEFQIEAARRARDTILNDELATEEHKRAARRKFEADERRIRTERARQERENTLIQIAVDTAAGVAKVLAQTGAVAPFVIPSIIALGLAQAAFVASQPLPKFATGTMNAPEGLAYTDEKGAELHTDKKGNIKDFGSSKGARIKYLEEGDKIYTASKTKEILSNLTSSELQNAIFNLNMRSNDEILKDNVVDMVLLNEIKGMKSSNEKVWREVKKLAERPINIDNELYLTDNRPY